jgi:predicted anti-sigma-YlaC factor YlaD
MVSGHVSRDLLAWAEQRLAPAERAAVDAHLRMCRECRTEADEMARLADTLNHLPKALRGLPGTSSRAWPAVWARVQRSPLPRALPRLSFYLSLAGVVFAIAAALPAGLGLQPLAVTAGVVETPVAANATLAATSTTDAQAGPTAGRDAQAATAAWPIPVPTPMPGVKG